MTRRVDQSLARLDEIAPLGRTQRPVARSIPPGAAWPLPYAQKAVARSESTGASRRVAPGSTNSVATALPAQKAAEASKPDGGITTSPSAENATESDSEGSTHIASTLDAWPFEAANTAHFLHAEPDPIPWFVHERIQQGRGILITGVGGSSKTRLQYHLAIGAAIGRLPWGWTVSRRGSSVLVLTEDVASDVHRTLWSTCKAMGLTQAERDLVAKHVHCYPLAGQNCKLLGLDPYTGELLQNGMLAGLEEIIHRLGDTVFVGLDPALSLTPGDELNQGHQRALGKMADDLAVRTGAAVALVAHASKASLNRDELGSHNSRGGGAITDAVRGEFSMRTMTSREAADAGIQDKEIRNRHVQLVATKGNHLPAEAFVEVWLRRGDFGTLSAANLEFSGKNETAVTTGRDKKILNVLVELCRDHTPKLDEWREACVKQNLISADSDDAQRQAMKRTVSRLLAAGEITRGTGMGIYLPAGDCDE